MVTEAHAPPEKNSVQIKSNHCAMSYLCVPIEKPEQPLILIWSDHCVNKTAEEGICVFADVGGRHGIYPGPRQHLWDSLTVYETPRLHKPTRY